MCKFKFKFLNLNLNVYSNLNKNFQVKDFKVSSATLTLITNNKDRNWGKPEWKC